MIKSRTLSLSFIPFCSVGFCSAGRRVPYMYIIQARQPFDLDKTRKRRVLFLAHLRHVTNTVVQFQQFAIFLPSALCVLLSFKSEVLKILTNRTEESFPAGIAITIEWLVTSSTLAARHGCTLGAVICLISESASIHQTIASERSQCSKCSSWLGKRQAERGSDCRANKSTRN